VAQPLSQIDMTNAITEVLRENGHSPSEAFNETVEEATQSLYPLIGKNGMDWMYEACSTTARRYVVLKTRQSYID